MNHSQKQRAENEVVFKQRNNVVNNVAKDLQRVGLDPGIVLKFTCECSNENCHETVGLTVSQYESARTTSRHFVVRAGHEQNDIERVVKHADYSIVEKFEEPPRTDGKLNKTR